MDFAFVPFIGNLQEAAQAFCQSHPNTTVLKAGCDTIGDFLVSAEAAAAGPLNVNIAEDLVPVTHADEERVILIDPAPGISGSLSYELLQGLNAIQIPADLKKPTTSFRVFGCPIGAQRCEPFLRAYEAGAGRSARPRRQQVRLLPDNAKRHGISGTGMSNYSGFATQLPESARSLFATSTKWSTRSGLRSRSS